MSIAATKAAIRALSPLLEVSMTAGEYRISIAKDAIQARHGWGREVERNEAIAYYTEDAEDAIGTARDMVARWEASK